MNGFALRQPQSDRLTVVAWILTRTSSSFGTGRSTSSTRRTSGGPYRSWTTALISHGHDDFSACVSFPEVAESVADVTQLEASVDDRFHRSGREQLLQDREVVLVHLGDEIDHLLAP